MLALLLLSVAFAFTGVWTSTQSCASTSCRFILCTNTPSGYQGVLVQRMNRQEWNCTSSRLTHSAIMFSFLILSFLLTEAATGLVSVKVGETAVLNCSDSRTPISAVEWIKEDRPPKNILFYSDGHLDPDHQHSTFKDRVELLDLQLKGGDLSLLLKDVVLSDAGTYQCLVAAGHSRRRKRALIDGEPVRTIQLEVRDSANDNSMNEPVRRSVVGSVAGVVLFLVVVGAVMFGHGVYKRRLVKRSDEDEAVNHQFIKHSVEQQNPDSSP